MISDTCKCGSRFDVVNGSAKRERESHLDWLRHHAACYSYTATHTRKKGKVDCVIASMAAAVGVHPVELQEAFDGVEYRLSKMDVPTKCD